MGPPQVCFSFRVELPTVLFLYAWCLSLCMLYAFRCHAACHIHIWGLNNWGLHHCNPSELTYGWYMCNLAMVISPHQECNEWLLPPLLCIGRAFCYSISCPPAILTIWWGKQLGGVGRESPNPSIFPVWWGGVFCSRFGMTWFTMNL